MAFGIANSLGFLALSFLIPLIILYLIKPQPKKLEIPSLMFITQTYHKVKQHTFLKKILKDPLFILQLLVLLFLIFSLMQPWIELKETISAENTIIVLDVSASMQTQNRFENAVKHAKSNLGGKNTIILSQTTPLIALQDAAKSEAKKFLSNMQPTDGTSDLGNAIILASEFAKEESKVIVISDFIHTQGIAPLTAKSVLESKDIPIDFINVGTKSDNNIGIIDARIEPEKTTVFIKNYNEEPATVTLQVNNIVEDIDIPAKSTETYSFITPEGTTKVELQYEDDLLVDNVAYISNPVDNKIKVLLISNVESRYLPSALESGDNIELTKTEPPIVPEGDFEVYVFYGITPDKILPGTFEEIMKKVEKGEASVVIHAQKTMQQINYDHLLPVKIKGFRTQSGLIEPKLITSLTKDVDFGEIRKYFDVENKNRVKTIAEANKVPVVSAINFGGGQLVYYGLLEEESDFKLSPSYPIFWVRLMKVLSNKRDISESNLKTGITLDLKKAVVLDKVKTYKLGKNIIAANLFNERESDLNIEKLQGTKIKEFETGKTKTKNKNDLERLMIIIAFVIFLIEFTYAKIRGDL